MIGSFQHRQLSLVLLRRLLSNDWQELWPNWPVETQTTFCNEVLLCTQNELNEALRKRFCDLVAEVARNTIGRFLSASVSCLTANGYCFR